MPTRGACPLIDWSAWVFEPGSAGLLADYDGTIAPVVADRDKAVPEPGAAEVLSSLASKLALVGIVSGRPLTFLLDQLGGVGGLALFGIYGLESCRTGNQHAGLARRVRPDALAWETVVSHAASEAEAQLPEAVEVEKKGLSFTLHVRRRPEMASPAHAWALEAAARTGLRVQPGRMSFELLPPVPAGKDLVVEEVAASLEALCFAGDDRGDLVAFEALRRLRERGKATLRLGIASAEQPPELAASVDVMLEGPKVFVGVLAALAGALER